LTDDPVADIDEISVSESFDFSGHRVHLTDNPVSERVENDDSVSDQSEVLVPD
jgi:hypothetical protein